MGGSESEKEKKLSELQELIKSELGERSKKFTKKKWDSLMKEVVWWLLDEKEEDEDDIVATACGLLLYGATTEEKLQNIGRGDYDKFTEKLSAEGVPKAICDLLFEKYVSRKLPPAKNIPLESIRSDVLGNLKFKGIQDRLKLPMFNKKIPAKPGNVESPNMLMYDLKNPNNTSSDVYTYLKKTATLGPSVLYGTSGCGKTRSIFEFLSVNYGFYFVCISDRNPGSNDMISALQMLSRDLKLEGENSRRYDIAYEALIPVVLSRVLVFSWLCEVLGRAPIPYEWLVAQLYPVHVFGDDVFLELSNRLLVSCAWKEVQSELFEAFPRLVIKESLHMFVDEAQVLLRGPTKAEDWSSLFSSRQDGKSEEARSMYSGVLDGLCKIATQLGAKYIGYPNLAGTGMSKDSAELAIGSYAAKENLRNENYYPVFQNFPALSRDGVEKYMNCVVKGDLKKLSKVYKNHICNWLSGRARWTATFLSLYLRKYQGKNNRRGPQLVACLDEYLDLMTSKPSDESKRHSGSLGSVSAYTLFGDLWKHSHEVFVKQNDVGDEKVKFSLSTTVARAILEYSLTGNPVTISHKNSSRAIEAGVCYLDGSAKVSVSEPLIVEAGVKFLGFEDFTGLKMDGTADTPSSAGLMFETFALPHILRELSSQTLEAFIRHFDGDDVFIPSQFRSKMNIGRSAYGVFAKKCTSADETMTWIEQSFDSSLDGSVPPFCFPDNLMGSDLLVFLREEMWQMKFQTVTNVTSALRRVIPELQYHKKRDSEPVPILEGTTLRRWLALFKKLFGEVRANKKRERGTLSVVLQSAKVLCYEKTTSPGAVPLDERARSSALSESRMKSDGPCDMQLVIYGGTLRYLLGDDLCDVIKELKE